MAYLLQRFCRYGGGQCRHSESEKIRSKSPAKRLNRKISFTEPSTELTRHENSPHCSALYHLVKYMQKLVLLRGERNTSGQAAVSLAPESVQKFNGSKGHARVQSSSVSCPGLGSHAHTSILREFSKSRTIRKDPSTRPACLESFGSAQNKLHRPGQRRGALDSSA